MFLPLLRESRSLVTYSGEGLPRICFLPKQCIFIKAELLWWNENFEDSFFFKLHMTS